jgi:hypothetical protein
MLSDVLIPLFDFRQDDQVGAYEVALDRLGEAAEHVDVVVPGSGAVAEGPEVAARLAADHAYVDALQLGEDRSTRVWGRMRTGSPAPTGRTWSRPEGGRAPGGPWRVCRIDTLTKLVGSRRSRRETFLRMQSEGELSNEPRALASAGPSAGSKIVSIFVALVRRLGRGG